ncbi:MAG: hypothetical protein QS748_10550 [Candidatus Endonucleobacter bathymodioli]|uniref:Lipoprotein n=1 Tax=Candidatus Endonucleibacter bathymodioli TaxID=539814 RepID=A0AA90NX73_9GAMM|nr:hypothetical protein [Candidatus Endonucleobacter bathymodioli]
MKKQTSIALLPLIMALAYLIGGCSQQQDENSSDTTAPGDSTYKTSEESYNCSSLDNSNHRKQSWCDAKALFDQKGLKHETFKSYVHGYRNGLNDAIQAKNSKLPRTPLTTDKKESSEDTGYRDGYQSLITKLGLLEFVCTDDGVASEYRERWCEAADSYRLAGNSDDNPFLRSRYIDGFMTGGRIALTVPSSMESFLDGEAPEGKQPSIVVPEGDLLGTELAFYRGFDDGYKAMIASIRESINQVMEQMQMSNDMQLPDMPGEGTVAPPPAQEN